MLTNVSAWMTTPPDIVCARLQCGSACDRVVGKVSTYLDVVRWAVVWLCLQWPFLLTLCCRHVWRAITGWCGCSLTPPGFYLETRTRALAYLTGFLHPQEAMLLYLDLWSLHKMFSLLATWEERQCGLPGGHQDSTHEHTEGSQPFSRVFGKWTQGMSVSVCAAARIWRCLWFDQTMRVYRPWWLACQSLGDLSIACSASASGNFP